MGFGGLGSGDVSRRVLSSTPVGFWEYTFGMGRYNASWI